MARPERNTVDYFPFICDEGKKMFYIEETYGNDGFATFIKILRELAKTDFHYLNLRKSTTQMFLSAKCKVSKEVLISIINDLAELGKFDLNLWNESRIIWCQDFIDSIQDAYKKRNNECMTYEGLHILLTSLGILNKHLSISTVPVNTQRKEKKSIEDKSKEEKSKIEFYPFDEFWNDYDKKVDTKKCRSKWDKVSEKDRKLIKEYLPNYKLSTPDIKYRKNPETFLNNQSWNDQIVKSNNTPVRRMVEYMMLGQFHTHTEKAYKENLQSLGSENVQFLNYVNGN